MPHPTGDSPPAARRRWLGHVVRRGCDRVGLWEHLLVGAIGGRGVRGPGGPPGERWVDAVYRDDEVLAGLEPCDDALVFDWMQRMLPAGGSKVAWDRAPGEHSHWRCGRTGHSSTWSSRGSCRRPVAAAA